MHYILSMEAEVHGDAYAIIGMPLAMLCTYACCGDVTANVFRYSLLQHLQCNCMHVAVLGASDIQHRCSMLKIFNSKMAYNRRDKDDYHHNREQGGDGGGS